MKKSRNNKTLAEKVLMGYGISHTVHLYNNQERDAVKVASLIGVPAGQLFKSLIVLRERGKPLLVMVPADRQLDLKKLARAIGEKKLKMATHAEAEKRTRLKVGGISPLVLLNHGFEMVIDQSCHRWETIFLSAGRKGINLEIPVAGVLEVTAPKILELLADRLNSYD